MKNLIMLFLATSLTVSSVEAKEDKSKKKVHHDQSIELTSKQKQLLTTALNTAKRDGHKNPYLLPGIIMVESKAGTALRFRTAKHKPARDQSVGIAQIIASTAKGVIKRHPEVKQTMGNKGLEYELAHNDLFNINIASNYLNDLAEITHSDAQLLGAYNTGYVVKQPERMHYVKKVQKEILKLKREGL